MWLLKSIILPMRKMAFLTYTKRIKSGLLYVWPGKHLEWTVCGHVHPGFVVLNCIQIKSTTA